MKNLFSGLLLILFAITQINAQEVSVEYGESFSLPKKFDSQYEFGNRKEGFKFALLSRKKKKFEFFNIRPDLKFDGSNEVNLDEIPKGYQDEYFINTRNQYFWLYSTWDRSQERESLLAQPFDFKSAKFVGQPKVIATSDVKLVGTLAATGFYSFESVGKYNFYRSADSSKLLIKYTLKPKERNDKINHQEFGFVVYDNSFNTLWSKVFEMPYTEELLVIKDIQLTNNGDVLLLAKVYDEKRKESKKGEDDPNYAYQLLRFSKSEQKAKVIPINTNGNYITNSYIYEDKVGGIFFLGYYSKSKNAGVDGIFTFKMKDINSGSFSTRQFSEFSNEILAAFTNKNKVVEKGKDEGKDFSANDLEISDVIPTKDGGFYVLGEVNYSYTYTQYSSSGGSYTRTVYYFEDIYASKIDNSGKILWVTKVPKRQKGGSSPGGISFNYIVKEDNLYLLYVENQKNLDIEPGKKPAYHNDGLGGQLFATKIDAKGKIVSRNIILDVKEEGNRFKINSFNHFGTSLVNTAFHKKLKYRPMVITVK